MILQEHSDQANRWDAVELFIKTLDAKPDVMGMQVDPERVASALVIGADILMAYILKGEKPKP